MTSIIWFAMGIVVASALLGSLVLGFLTPTVSSVITLQEKCEKIAKEGFQIHASYPDLQLDQLPTGDMNRLMYLDEMWIKDCVSGLSAESIFNIVQKVEHDFYTGQ